MTAEAAKNQVSTVVHGIGIGVEVNKHAPTFWSFLSSMTSTGVAAIAPLLTAGPFLRLRS